MLILCAVPNLCTGESLSSLPDFVEDFDQKAYALARMFPMYLDHLRNGEYSELSITVTEVDGETVFVLNAVSHKTCEEHGCQDDDCRQILHAKSIAIPMRDLDKIIDALFYSVHQSKSPNIFSPR